MLHYLLYKALLDERTRDLVAESRCHQLVAEAIHDSGQGNEWAPRLKTVTASLVLRFNGRRGARAGSTATSVSGVGPMGCSA